MGTHVHKIQANRQKKNTHTQQMDKADKCEKKSQPNFLNSWETETIQNEKNYALPKKNMVLCFIYETDIIIFFFHFAKQGTQHTEKCDTTKTEKRQTNTLYNIHV